MTTYKKTQNMSGAKPSLTAVASAAALLLLSGGVQAASFGVTLPFGQPTAIAQIVAQGYHQNFTPVLAQAVNNGTSISQVGSGINATFGNTDNSIGAISAGNRSVQTIASLAITPNGIGQGAVASSVAQNQGRITSLAGFNTISNTQAALIGSSTVSGNRIYAETTVNENSSAITGPLPNGFNVAGAGSVVGSSGLGTVAVQGGLLAVTTQNSLEGTASSATADSNTVALTLGQSGGFVTGSATLDRNQVSATFRGNETDNSIAVAAGGAPAFVGSAVASNTQARSGAGSYADTFNTNVVGSVGATSFGSLSGSLSVQQNAVGSEASGNSANNAITVANSVSVSAGTGSPTVASAASTQGGLVVASNQSNVGNASLRSDTRQTRVLAQVGFPLQSTIDASSNAVSSQAVGNRVSNGISNASTTAGVGTSTVAGSALIGNVQENDVTSAAVPGVNGDIWARTHDTVIAAVSLSTGSGSTLSASNNTVSAQAAASSAGNTVDLQGAVLSLDPTNGGAVVSGGALVAGAGVLNVQRNTGTEVRSENSGAAIAVTAGGAPINTSLRADANALSSVASGNGSDNAVKIKGVDVDASTALSNQQSNTGSRIWATLGTDVTPYSVSAAAPDGLVTASQLSVRGNSGLASATANAATNQLAISGATLAGNAAGASSTAGIAVGDHVLSNDQTVTLTNVASGQRAFANGLFTAQGGITGLIAGNSSLSVSDNEQEARALGNTASNTLSLAGTTIASRSVLASSQVSGASVTSDSLLTLSAAPTSSSQAAVTLDNNRNTAMAITNRVFNTTQVQGTNVGPLAGGQALVDGTQTSAAHALSNLQVGNGAQAFSYASTSLNNFVAGASANGSSLAATDNVTWAESVVNFASNRLDVTGSANLGGSAAIQNTQNSLVASVTATSQTNLAGSRYTFGLNSANASSVALNGNSTVALAYGNSAANALNAVAGASYAPGSGAAPAVVMPYSVQGAQYALLNTQANTSAVTANGSAIYEVGALNALNASNSGLNVAGNSVAAVAYGNSSTNALQVAALNSGAPTAAVANSQSNVGAITASASGSSMAITGVTATNSSLAVRGNQITATAVGNSSTSSVLAAR